MANNDIRNEILGAGLKLWQIAEALGIRDSEFSRKLRLELPEETKDKIRSIIKDLKGCE